MRLPPLWKIYRELDRSRQAIHSAIGRLYEPFVQQRHDRNRDQILRIHDGHVGLHQKVALFLIFQPAGLQKSVLVTCDHLIEKGYAPLVVSNAPLNAEDLEAVRSRAWKIIVRPNFGYDFGGYRDGILWLRDQGVTPERLLILNDSIWFPVWPNETMIDKMEALPVDLAGAVIHPEQRRRKTSTLRPAFIESYFYIAQRNALKSDVFYKFWTDFQVSSIKFNAVYRGERSFTNFLEGGGLTCDAIVSAEALIAAVAAEDNDFLKKTLEYAAYTDPEFEAERDALLAGRDKTSGWREVALAHVAKVSRRRSVYASFPYPACLKLGVSFVKKSRLMFFRQAYGTVQIKMRSQLVRAIHAGDLPKPFPEVLAEIEARDLVTT